MRKADVIKAIDEVMNNREIDSIRNAILAIRDKVSEMDDVHVSVARLPLRGKEINCIGEYFEGADYLVVDTFYKIDTGIYGAYWYE